MRQIPAHPTSQGESEIDPQPIVSGNFPHPADESEMERLFRRGRVGICRTRMARGKYFEADANYPGGLKLPRVRRSFTSASAAVRWAQQITQEIREHGRLARVLTTGQRWVAAECFQKLAAIGRTAAVDLLHVVDEYLKRHPLSGLARTLDDLRKEVVGAKKSKKRSERHVLGLDYKLRKLAEAIGNKPITTITTADLDRELGRHPDWKPTTVHSAVQSWKIALNFAVKQGYLVENPANRLDLPQIVHDEPTIFTVAEVRRLMAATLFSDRDPLLPYCRPYLAIGMFAGLRPYEIEPLRWEHVDLETLTIRVKAVTAKDRDRRIVTIQPNLAAWLRPLARARGPVLEKPLEKLRVVARNVLGLGEWPSDVMRHIFVSYHFGQYRNEALTKAEVGHRDDGRVFYNHYMVPVSRRDAALFWATVPPVGLIDDIAWRTGCLQYDDGLAPLRRVGEVACAV